jgi:hypothetical protein
VVLDRAGTGWLAVVFLVEVTGIIDKGQWNAPRRGGGFLLVGFLCLNVGFLTGICSLPAVGSRFLVVCGQFLVGGRFLAGSSRFPAVGGQFLVGGRFPAVGGQFLIGGRFLAVGGRFPIGGDFSPGSGHARLVGRGVTPGKQGAQPPCLCSPAGRPLVSAIPRLVLVTRRRGTRATGNARRPGAPALACR